MDIDKLDRKLAEWSFDKVEFVCEPDEEYPRGIIYFWKGGQHLTCELFTLSETACFKWLVPKAIDKIMAEQECNSDFAYAILFKKWLQKLELMIPKATLALCLAIKKVIDNGH